MTRQVTSFLTTNPVDENNPTTIHLISAKKSKSVAANYYLNRVTNKLGGICSQHVEQPAPGV